MVDTIYNENCLDTMKRLDDEVIDLVVTSPPYDDMRTYGGYSFDFENVAKELTRTLKPGGVIMWNVADQTKNGTRSGTSFRQALYFMEECGLNLYDHLIWKKNGTPFPSTVRYRNVWENMFIFSKGKPKHFDPILKRNATGGDVRNHRRERDSDGELQRVNRRIQVKEWGIDDNVWNISNHFKKTDMRRIGAHPAIMPEEMAERHIKTWSQKGDLVYDPFSGSGTTSKVAFEMERKYLGSEMNKEYYDSSIELLNDTKHKRKFF